jgi:hypothetical protein
MPRNKAIETPVEAKQALTDFFIDSTKAELNAIPEDIRTRLRSLIEPGMSPVESAVHMSEAIFARADNLPTELLAIGAETASMCASYNFHAMGSNGRGNGIAAALRQREGVLVDYSANVAVNLAPLQEFAPEGTLGVQAPLDPSA